MEVLIVDGSYLCHTALHARTGQLTNGVLFGALRSLLLEAREADHVTVCFDVGGIDTLLRKKLGTSASEAYKENRRTKKVTISEDEDEFGGTPDPGEESRVAMADFYRQRSVFKWACEHLGFECQWADGYEADDVIAVNVNAHRAAGNSMRIVSNDSDLYQLFTGEDDIDRGDLVFARTGGTGGDFDYQDFKNRYVCRAQWWAQVKAIAGDSTDNVIGVPGVGIKTAVKVMRGTASDAVEHLIKAHARLIADNLELVKLPFDASVIGNGLELCVTTTGVGKCLKERLDAFAGEYGMPSLTKIGV